MNGSRLLCLLIAIGFSILTTGCQTTEVTRATAFSHGEQMSREQALALVKAKAEYMIQYRGKTHTEYAYVSGMNELGLIISKDSNLLFPDVSVGLALEGTAYLTKPPRTTDSAIAFDEVYKIAKRRGGYIDVYARSHKQKILFPCPENIDQLVVALYVLCPNLQ